MKGVISEGWTAERDGGRPPGAVPMVSPSNVDKKGLRRCVVNYDKASGRASLRFREEFFAKPVKLLSPSEVVPRLGGELLS